MLSPRLDRAEDGEVTEACAARASLKAVGAVLQDWASPGGASIALQCVVDLLGNACNADDPARLPLVGRPAHKLISARTIRANPS